MDGNSTEARKFVRAVKAEAADMRTRDPAYSHGNALVRETFAGQHVDVIFASAMTVAIKELDADHRAARAP